MDWVGQTNGRITTESPGARRRSVMWSLLEVGLEAAAGPRCRVPELVVALKSISPQVPPVGLAVAVVILVVAGVARTEREVQGRAVEQVGRVESQRLPVRRMAPADPVPQTPRRLVRPEVYPLELAEVREVHRPRRHVVEAMVVRESSSFVTQRLTSSALLRR